MEQCITKHLVQSKMNVTAQAVHGLKSEVITMALHDP